MALNIRYTSLGWLMPLLFSQLPVGSATEIKTVGAYDWKEISTTSHTANNVSWTPCFGGDFLCTRLEVPLDWEDEKVGTTKVAFVKYPSKNNTAEDLVLNFGGPGGSGVGNLLALAPALVDRFGSNVNLVSFDPRGVNNTGPELNCFPGNSANERTYETTYFRSVAGPSSSEVVSQYYQAQGYGEWCNQVLGGPNGTAKYANTPAVARDVLTYSEIFHASKGKEKKDAKIWYGGFSYGGTLGTTIAAIYPDRIGRMVLDGPDDGEDYYKGSWSSNLIDADAVVEQFISTCYDAGVDACPFYKPSKEAITARLNKIIASVKSEPIPVTNSSIVGMPILATHADLTTVLLNALYFPLGSFPKLAQILVDLEGGIGESLMIARGLVFDSQCGAETGYGAIQAQNLISCIDASGRNKLTSLKQAQNYVNLLKRQSKYVGEAWASNVLSCMSLDSLPPKSGQFTGQLPPQAKKTSFPILFIGNTHDPVTPLKNTRKAVSLFPKSLLIEVDALGHTSLASPSDCTSKKVQEYLAGTLDASLTKCKANEVPFKSKLEGVAQLSNI